jgi:hypothetical protein
MPVLPAHGVPLYSANPLTSLFPSTYHGFNKTARSLEEKNRKDKNAHTTTTHISRQSNAASALFSFLTIMRDHSPSLTPTGATPKPLALRPSSLQTNQTKKNYEPTKTTTTPKNDDTAVIALTLLSSFFKTPRNTQKGDETLNSASQTHGICKTFLKQ